MNDIEHELGRLAGESAAMSKRLERVESKLDRHMEDEDAKLRHIEQQLSLSHFLWLTVKAVVLTIAFMLAFKFGDIANLWKALK